MPKKKPTPRVIKILPAKLWVSIDGHKKHVATAAYVGAKCNQLREFGYANLTEETVREQLLALINGKKLGEGLTVIGGFMQDEILL